MNHKVIIDTDIGDDIDDLFALVFALKNRCIDIGYIMVSSGDVHYKAKLVASVLKTFHMEHIVIIKGNMAPHGCLAQNRLLKGFDLNQYAGIIKENYEEALEEAFLKHGTLDILELGPINDLAHFFFNHPTYCKQACIYYMGGAVHHGYINQDHADAEYNVLISHEATNQMFEKISSLCLLPLDCCYDLILNSSAYQEFLKMDSIAANLLKKHYQVWLEDYRGGSIKFDYQQSTSILYDVVVILYYLYPSFFETMEEPLWIDEKGCVLFTGKKNILYASCLKEKKQWMDCFLTSMKD